MSTTTPNYGWILPGVNDPTDQDLWGGYLNSNISSQDTIIKQISNASMLPVGSLYFNATDGTNPATLLGYGTWASFGMGQVLIGVGTGTDINSVSQTFAAGDEDGEYVHTLTTAEIPPVSVTMNQAMKQTGDLGGGAQYTGIRINGGGALYAGTTAGGGGSHNNVQPYISVYIWSRTA